MPLSEEARSSARELNKLLRTTANKPIRTRRSNRDYPVEATAESESQNMSGFCNWTTVDGQSFFPAGQTKRKLEPGLYEPSYCHQRGHFLKKINIKTEGLLRFPEANSEKVIEEIGCFWDKKDVYAKYDLTYKRGLLLWGPPGSGKSSTIQIVLKDVIDRNGVAFKFDDPDWFLACVRFFREIQPETPLIALMEDIDSILHDYSETDVLNILDGIEKVENTVFLASTNYPEQLGDRIVNRPSRFDRRIRMGHPNSESRKIYFDHLFAKIGNHQYDVDKWVENTEAMSIAHLKELFVSVCILGDPYDETIETLRTMVDDRPDSKNDTKEFEEEFGFAHGKTPARRL